MKRVTIKPTPANKALPAETAAGWLFLQVLAAIIAITAPIASTLCMLILSPVIANPTAAV